MGKKNYGVGAEIGQRKIPAPVLSHEPRDPRRYRPAIGLIGCGGITQMHLRAYKAAGYNVVALCDVNIDQAEARRRAFYRQATVYGDYRDLLRRDDVEVVDIATHPAQRVPLITAALCAGKHVLSQKPFVLDLDVGERLVALAEERGLRLAVNHNGRWAPHFSYLRHAVAKGLIGDLLSAHLSVHWNHDWIGTNPNFNSVKHIILYDFGIHWFDLTNCFFGGQKPRRVFASVARAPGQQSRPPLLGQALIEFDGAQASLVFDGFAQYGPHDRCYLGGTKGTLISAGRNFNEQRVTLYTKRGVATPKLRGRWFPDGFHGTMGELLCAIEENREPDNSAASSLPGLATCFAALASAETGRPQVPGRVRRLPAAAVRV